MKDHFLLLFKRQILFSCVLLLSASSLWAAPPPDVRLLIDVSGSMRQNDPQNLRIPALRLVNELLPLGAEAGVWLFADKTEALVPPGVVNEAWKTRTRSRLERIHSRGALTDIEQALTAGLSGWEASKEATDRHLVLLTDGLVDVGKDPTQSAASRTRILSEQLARLRALHVKVHAVALSDAVDAELLRILTSDTGGWLEKAADADALQRIFLHMLEQAAAPTTVPLSGNQFQIDAQVSEFTLLAFRSGEMATALITPDGKTISGTKPTPNVLWREEEGYDLVTLTTPQSGRWQLQGVSDPDNRVVVVTDLGLELEPLPGVLPHGAKLNISAWLTNHQQPVTRQDLLQLVTAKVTLTQLDTAVVPAAAPAPPDHPAPAPAHHDAPAHSALEPPHLLDFVGNVYAAEVPPPSHDAEKNHLAPIEVRLELDPATGRYHTELETNPLAPGNYQLQIILDSGTFQRQLAKRFRLIGAPLTVNYQVQLPTEVTPTATIVATLTAEADLVDLKTLSGYLRAHSTTGQQVVLDIPQPTTQPLVLTLPIAHPGSYRVEGRLLARSRSGEPIDVTPAPEQLEVQFAAPATDADAPTAPLSWLDVSLYVMLGNVALGAFLGLTWWLLRRSKQRALAAQITTSSTMASA
ncbi:hypothetical protein CKO12_10990 [Chromatium okenii]|uniref:VWA domain-containing protein n=1 Tax=Chromatium okenii TaxID=61644 RepID=UPI001905DDC7|nr:vWA domain-containing protein [Chromatium okenii]MBK1642392.1 hypothetical protein [Chromatium okenii]